MNTPFDQLMADPLALRALGRGIRRYMWYAFVAGVAIGVLVGWLVL